MFRCISHWVLAAAFLLLPAGLMAGGPPFVCLPVDGVTSQNVQVCSKLLNSKLEDKLWTRSSLPHGVKLIERTNQWYLAFYMDKDVRLSDVLAALQGSEFSIPQDRLHLFGHAILDIDAPAASRQALLSALKSLPHVSVEESKTQDKLLLVTLDMPYPVAWKEDLESAGWEKFQRNDFNSNQSTHSRNPATTKELPSYETIGDVVSKHNASLKDIRWSTHYACRPLGGVAESRPAAQEAGTSNSPEAALPVGKWNVEFTNGVIEVCSIGNSGDSTVEEPRRQSNGMAVVKEGSVVITFNDDRIERWTPVGKRFVVEHWFPGSQRTAVTPVLGIAERAQ
jgi:hypothetical protein